MNKALIIALMLMLLSACAPQGQPTEIEPDVVEQATQANVDLTPAQRLAVSAVVHNLSIPVQQAKVVSTEAVDWPDSCLGISAEGTACAEVITPGFRIFLDAAGRQVEYHTNQDGSVILPATIALTWTRAGGIAGFCDSLTVYLSGEVRASNCNASKVVEKPLSEVSSPERITMMNDLISTYGTVNIDASDPKGVSDAMTIKLQLIGQGAETLTSPQARQSLLQFAQELYGKLTNP